LQGDRLVRVVGEPKAPVLPERVSGELSHSNERAFREAPELSGAIGPQLRPGDVVGSGGAAESEATVAAAGPTRDLACLVDAHS
jgi:hypothetical protein